MGNGKPGRVWDSKECAVLLIDYQELTNTEARIPKWREPVRHLAGLIKSNASLNQDIHIETVGAGEQREAPCLHTWLLERLAAQSERIGELEARLRLAERSLSLL